MAEPGFWARRDSAPLSQEKFSPILHENCLKFTRFQRHFFRIFSNLREFSPCFPLIFSDSFFNFFLVLWENSFDFAGTEKSPLNFRWYWRKTFFNLFQIRKIISQIFSDIGKTGLNFLQVSCQKNNINMWIMATWFWLFRRIYCLYHIFFSFSEISFFLFSDLFLPSPDIELIVIDGCPFLKV